MKLISVSAIIPTKDRPSMLIRTIKSLLASTMVPAEFVVIDASDSGEAADAIQELFAGRADGPRLIWQSAQTIGAAVQRNQAVGLATQDYVLFCDDDIVAEPDCIERLWTAMQGDSAIGGANAMIVNQSYTRPRWPTRTMLALLGIFERDGYAGRVVGPAIHFLPRDKGDGAAAVPMQWLNTTCTLYRRALLPVPPFDRHFSGYALGEDVALSLRVGAYARLVNVPAARIVHDSQPGPHKADKAALSRMDVVNRHYIMTEVMGRRGRLDYGRLLVWEIYQLAVSAIRERGGAAFRQTLRGRLLAAGDLSRRRAAP